MIHNSIPAPYVQTELDKLDSKINAIRGAYYPTYSAPTEFGCTINDSLQTIIDKLPNNSQCIFWTNATNSYPTVYTDLWAIIEGFGGNEAFGNVVLKKRARTTRVTWEHYQSCFTIMGNYTEINNKGWAEWVVTTPYVAPTAIASEDEI